MTTNVGTLESLLREVRDDVAELLERMKAEGWHRAERIEYQEKLLSRIDTYLATGGWMPIETAPRDDAAILATGGFFFFADGLSGIPMNFIQKVYWNDLENRFDDGVGDGKLWYVPTHYQPIPSLPKEPK